MVSEIVTVVRAQQHVGPIELAHLLHGVQYPHVCDRDEATVRLATRAHATRASASSLQVSSTDISALQRFFASASIVAVSLASKYGWQEVSSAKSVPCCRATPARVRAINGPTSHRLRVAAAAKAGECWAALTHHSAGPVVQGAALPGGARTHGPNRTWPE